MGALHRGTKVRDAWLPNWVRDPAASKESGRNFARRRGAWRRTTVRNDRPVAALASSSGEHVAGVVFPAADSPRLG